MPAKIRIHHGITLVLVICFLASYFFPGVAFSETINMVLAVIGILFGIIVGFFITDLWTRFENIRESVSKEVSGWSTYFTLCKILGARKKHKKWVEGQRKLIDKYITKFISIEWANYADTEPEFDAINDSLIDLKELKGIKEDETWAIMLANLSAISDAREKLIIFGKDKLGKAEWMVIGMLGIALLGALFYLKTPEPASIIFTWLLSSAIIVLFLVLRDLSNLSYGEEIVSFDPYEKVLDTIEMPRFYLKEHIKSGRAKPPKGKKYRVG